MLKNVATKLIVYCWDSTTGLPKTGDAANLTAYVSLDFDTSPDAIADTSATEFSSTNAKGYYLFDLAQGETNGDINLYTCKSATANIVCICVPAVVHTLPTTGVLAPVTAGRTLVVDAAGLADANVVKLGPTGSGTAQTARDLGAITANTITHLNTIYDTDYATIYDTTNKAFLAKLGNFAMGGSSLALTTGAIACTTITASGAVAFQSTFAVTTSTALGAISGSTLTLSGAVAFQSTFATTGTTTFNALTVTNALTVSGATTLTGAVTASNASNSINLGTDSISSTQIAASAVTEIQSGLSTLTQTQVTGGAYAINSSSFAFNSALDLTTTQKASVNTEADTAATDYGALQPTTAGRKLDVTTTGEAGIDWANVGSPSSVVTLLNTTVAAVTSVSSVSSVSSLGSGAITNGVFGAGAIDAAAIAANAIGASELAADAAAEIAAAVWDLDATAHQTQGTFGQAIGDPSDSDSIWALANTNLDAAVSTRATPTNITAASGVSLTSSYDFAKGTVAMTEAYAANGAAPTAVQALMAIHQMLMQFAISGTSVTVKKLDNSTTAFVVTLNDGTSPTSAVRT